MRFSDYLLESNILLDLRSDSKQQVIRELAEPLRNSPAVLEFEKFLADVYAREQEGPTGLGHAVAVPHARTDSLKDFVVALGRSRSGIEFGASDKQPARLVILLGTPLAMVKAYLKVLAHLSHLVRKPGFVDSVLSAPDAKAIVSLFRASER